MPDVFEDIASRYHARAQYHPLFFERLAKELKLHRDSRLLDAGCGGGELAKGFSPYVGEVVAIDISEDMLNLARVNAPSNILFRKGEVGNCNVGNFDAIAVGRALRYMPREPTIKYFEGVLPKGGAVVTCTAGIEAATSWRKEFGNVMRRYGYRADAFSFKDTSYFSATSFKYIDLVHTKNQAEYTLKSLTENALSFRSSHERISSNIRQFQGDLETALKPYLNENGSLNAMVGSVAFIFKKV